MACATTSRFRTLVLGMVVAAPGVGLTGCGTGGQEQEIINGFFRASRVDDRGTMGNISMVDFDAREDGLVRNVSVESVGEEQRRTLRLQELSEALAEARAARDEQAAEMRAYQDENFEAIARVIEAERAGEEGQDEDVQVQWTEFRDESAELAAAVSEAERALAEESRVAERSAFNPENPVNVRQYEGELVSKDVTVTADVEREGMTEERTMVVTLQKVELGSGETMIDGRWMITAIE